MRHWIIALLVGAGLITAADRLQAADTITLHPVWSFGRTHSASAFDTRRRRMIVITGQNGVAQSTVEILDFSGEPAWRRPAVANPVQDGLLYASAVYDSLRDRVLLFGISPTSVYSLSMTAPMTWSVFTPSGSHVQLAGVQLAYDRVRDRVVGHGGFIDYGFSTQTVNDTWSLTLGGTPTWGALATAGGTPPTRADGVGVWDVAGDRMIVFGGYSTPGGTVYRSDAWQLSFTGGIPTWNPLTTSGGPPAGRRGFAGAMDLLRRQLVISGGLNNGTILSDTWTLGLDAGLAWQQVAGVDPPGRYSAMGAYDPTGQRMILAGGSNSFAAFAQLGDTWELPLGASPGPWQEVPVTGGPGIYVSFAGYDAAAHRFAGLGDATPWFLSTDDTMWHAVRSVGSGPRIPPTLLGRFYDERTNTIWVPTVDTLFSIQPTPGAAWTRTWIPDPRPPSVESQATIFLDRKRNRILMFGGAMVSTYGISTTEFWSLALGPSPAWAKISDTTPLGIRITPAIEDVRRDRLLFFGGAQPVHASPFIPLGDLWALDLATLQWSALAAAGTAPSPRSFFAATYDSTRDRAIVFGGMNYYTPQPGLYDLQFGPSDPNGAWTRNDPSGAVLPGYIDGIAGFDVARDRMYVAERANLYEIAFGVGSPGVAVSCPVATPWTAGAILPLSFDVTQSVGGSHSYAWTVRSQRGWPGFPLQGFQNFGDAGTIAVPVGIPVPDSAAAGTNTLRFVVKDLSNPGLADSCVTVISNVASPILWSVADIVVDGSGVHLLWHLSGGSVTSARIERRTESTAYAHLGDRAVGGDGSVAFDDGTVVGGTRYAYRAGYVLGADWAWSNEVWVDVPSGPPPGPTLAFAATGPIVARGALDVAIDLSADGLARLEAFDLAGRRMAVAEASGAGRHTLRLAEAGALRSGVYFLRLSQAGARVHARALVVDVR